MSTNLNLFEIYGMAIILLVVIADISSASTGERLNLCTAIPKSAQSFQRNLRIIAGESIFSIQFLLFTVLVVCAIFVLCLLVGGVITAKQMLSKLYWIFPTTLLAGVLTTILSFVAVKRLSDNQILFTAPLWLTVWLLIPILLWLAVMHFGTWLEWHETSSPLAYASEWFYAQVYDDYFRNSAGLRITIAIATTISLPVVVPIIFIATRTIRSITKVKRGVLGIFVVILFSATQLYENF